MTPDQASDAVVSWIGIVLQLAGSLLCLGLGLILRRNQRERRWMTCWVASFAAMSVAIGALLVRYYLLPLLPTPSLPVSQTQLVAVLYGVYFSAKLAFFFFMGSGTWLFVTRRPMPRRAVVGGLATILLAGAAVLVTRSELDPLMAIQAAFAVPLFLWCARMLLRLPPPQRTRGSDMLGAVCVILAVLWVLYALGFLFVGDVTSGSVAAFLRTLVFHNSYVDVLFEFVLGFAMILAVLDDVFLEAEAARTARLVEVAASEARLAQIIRAASEGIVLLDAARRIVHCNPAALAILACGDRDIIGESFDRFITIGAPGDLWTGPGDGAGRMEFTPQGGHELRGRRCDGREFPMEISVRGIVEGGSGGYVLVVRDRTEREQVEQERERNRAHLAQTARLETIGRMISGVAHELNNPLTAILAFAQDLQGQSRSLTDTEALTTIVQQAQRCRAIVLDLLTFARSKRDDREPISPLAIIRRVVPALERQATARGIRIEVLVSADLPHIEASPSEIEQVLTNLVVNAIQAVRPGGRVTLTGKATDNFLSLVVEDDGPGISAAAMPRLFEPFFTTKGPGEGTGLGLSVSHAIVEQHGGTLMAENRNPGERGARFTMRLPYLDRRSTMRTTPELPRSSLAPSPPAPLAPRSSRRVLVVDDEGPIRVAIRRYLERCGWTVEEAGDGREALSLLGLDEGGRFRADAYDAIVTDLRMPGLSGIELHDRLVAISPESVAKLVVITGDTASPEAAEFTGRLRQPLIQKPFDMRALADLLARMVPSDTPTGPPVF